MFVSLCAMSIMQVDGLCFAEFIEGISQFSVKGDKESKLRCKYNASVLGCIGAH